MGRLRKALLRHDKSNLNLRKIEADMNTEATAFVIFSWAAGGIVLATGAVLKFQPAYLFSGFLGVLFVLFLRHRWKLKTLGQRHVEGLETLNDAFEGLLDLVREDEVRHLPDPTTPLSLQDLQD